MQGNNAIRSGIFSSIIQFMKCKIGNVKRFATVVSYSKVNEKLRSINLYLKLRIQIFNRKPFYISNYK